MSRRNTIIGICGDVCSECPRYIGTRENDIPSLGKFAELWYKLGFRVRVVDPEELKCSGCNKEMPCSNGINNCPHLTEKANCGECDDFPCDKINAVFHKTDSLRETCKERCSASEYQQLSKAFLMKKEVLTQINRNYKKIKG
jgi:hypothetical protein